MPYLLLGVRAVQAAGAAAQGACRGAAAGEAAGVGHSAEEPAAGWAGQGKRRSDQGSTVFLFSAAGSPWELADVPDSRRTGLVFFVDSQIVSFLGCWYCITSGSRLGGQPLPILATFLRMSLRSTEEAQEALDIRPMREAHWADCCRLLAALKPHCPRWQLEAGLRKSTGQAHPWANVIVIFSQTAHRPS